MNPCFCMRLQTGTTIVAILNIAANISVIILFGFGLVAVLVLSPSDPDYEVLHKNKTLLIAVDAVVIGGGIFQTLISIYLWHSASNSNESGLKIWLTITAVLFVLKTIFVILLLATGRSLLSISIGAGSTLFTLYEMWVVYSFTQELKAQSTLSRVVPVPDVVKTLPDAKV